MICEKCKNFDRSKGVCTHLGCNYLDHICLNFERREDDVEEKMRDQIGKCYCANCMGKTAELVDVNGGILLYECKKCGRHLTYSLEELK